MAAGHATPTLVLQGDKTYQFRAVVVSDGGRWLASSDHGGGSIKIFDGHSGLQWGELPSSAEDVPLRFTPDATRILTMQTQESPDGRRDQIWLCEVTTGHKLRSFDVAPYPLWCDNTRLRGLNNGVLVEFDLKTGCQISQHKIQDSSTGRSQGFRFEFSQNGAFLVEGSAGVIRFWQARNGHLLGRIKDPLRAIGRTAISNDGKWLASEGDDPRWSPPAGAATEAAYARNFNLHVWKTQTRKLARTFPGYYSLFGGASVLAFSPDARTLLGAGEGGLDRFNIASSKNAPLPPTQKDFHNGMGSPLDVSSDGLWLAGVGQIYQSSDFGPGLQLWSIAASKLRTRFGGTLRGARQVKWSPDGKYLAGGNRLTLWDAHTGQLLAEKPDSYLYDFSWVDATTICSQTLGKMQIWSVPDLKLKSEFAFSTPRKGEPNFYSYSDGLSIAPDGRTILTTDTTQPGGSLRGELWVWDVAQKKLLRKIKTDKSSWGFNALHEILWLPDNWRILFSTHSKLVLLNTQTGTIEKEQADPDQSNSKAHPFDSALLPLRVSPDGQWVAVRASSNRKVLVFDLHTFDLNPLAGLQWWAEATATERKLRALGAPTDRGVSQDAQWDEGRGDISPDGRLMAFGSDSLWHNDVSIWNLKTGREVVRLYLLGGTAQSTSSDWIALTPSGYYNASPAGEQRLRWREGKSFWPLVKSRARFKRPALVRQALTP